MKEEIVEEASFFQFPAIFIDFLSLHWQTRLLASWDSVQRKTRRLSRKGGKGTIIKSARQR
jgi:hypothetical protein